MIAINGKPIDSLPKDDPIVVHISEGIAKIRKQQRWTFKFHPSQIKPADVNIPGSIEETSAGILLLASQKYVFKGLDYDLSYFSRMVNTGNDKVRFVPRRLDFKGKITYFSDREADLIFFYACISQECQEYEPLKRWQNPIKNQPIYMVQNIAAETAELNRQDYLLAEVKQLLFHPDKKLDDATIREAAIQHGVRRADDQSYNIEMVRRGLQNKLLVTKNNKYDFELIDKFVMNYKDQAAESIPGLEESINYAIENDLVRERKYGTNINIELFDYKDLKAKPVKVCATAEGKDIGEQMFIHFSNNPDLAIEFINTMNQAKEYIPEEDKNAGKSPGPEDDK